MQIGDNIRKIRDIKRLTQEDVAAKLNISQQAYGKIERNETKIDLERLQQIADALGVSTTDIQDFNEKNMFINQPQIYSNTLQGINTGVNLTVHNHIETEQILTFFQGLINQQQEFISQQNALIAAQRAEIDQLRTLLKQQP